MKKIYSFLRQTALSYCIRKGNKNNKIFENTSFSFMKINQSTLFKIIKDNKNTFYGKKYDFKNIKTLDDYKKKVPVSTYKDYEPYIDKMIFENKKNLITKYPVHFYAKTSGTTGESKKIPYSDKAIKIYNKYGGNNSILSRLYVNDNLSKLKNKFLILATCGLETFPDGSKYGGLTEKMLSHKKLLANFISVVPSRILFPKEGTDTLLFQARYALEEKDISYCYLTFCTQFLQLLQFIENNYKILIKDIRYGTIDDSFKISEKIKKTLLKKIKPKPERADELTQIFSQGFKGIVPRLWKSFSGFAGIANGGFKIYYDKLKYYFTDDINAYMYGYSTSEGLFSLCLNNNCENSLPVLENCFYEFLPLDENDYSKTKNLDEVVIGQEYRIIITNQSGLYRYNMHDIVKINDTLNGCPLISFVRRESQCLNVMGEKITIDDITTAITDTFKELSTNIIDYSVTINTSSPIGYDFFIESNSDFDIKKAENVLNTKLKNNCEYFTIFSDRGLLSKPRIYKLTKDTFADYKKYKDRAHNNQFKQLHILEDYDSINFFKNRIIK